LWPKLTALDPTVAAIVVTNLFELTGTDPFESPTVVASPRGEGRLAVRIAQVGIWVEFEIVGEYLIDFIDLWTDPILE
jgi:hypothetical protein